MEGITPQKTKQQIVDEFIAKNYQDIKQKKTELGSQFRWNTISQQINLCDPELKGLIFPEADYVRGRFDAHREKQGESNVTNTLPGYLANFTYQEDRDKGTAKLEDSVLEKPTDTQIFEKYKIDPKEFKISQIWFKDKQVGFHMSVLFSALKSQTQSVTSLTEEFSKFVESYNTKIFQSPKKIPKDRQRNPREFLYLQTLSDIHIGNFQKPNYIESIKERIKETMRSVENIGITKFVILNTGDMVHFDSSRSDTFGNTQLTGEMTYESAFTKALDLCTDLIDYASELALEVTFINVRGNHSYDTEYCLGESLKKIYKKDLSIEVINQNDNNFRTYYYWNNNAYLFAHGDKAIDKLPLIFATEGNEVFSKAKYRHIILGHLHHNQSKQFTNTVGEYNGIEVRVCGSPTSTDIWHKQNGFVGANKNIISFIFTPEEGKFAEYNFKL